MSKTRRLWNIFVAVLMIQTALILMLVPDAAFILIVIFLSLVLTFRGLKFLIYYLTHAQHMVGGKWLMLVGLVLLDLGALAMILIEQAPSIMIFYVAGVHLVSAVINIARAISNKGDGNPGWKTDLAQGIGNIILVALCLIFINHVEIPVFIYCTGVIYSAILKIIASCKRTAIVYVQ